jgi:E3 ubiquitin-protein ligase MYCBP2
MMSTSVLQIILQDITFESELTELQSLGDELQEHASDMPGVVQLFDDICAREEMIQDFLSERAHGLCHVCLSEKDLLLLDCKHAFCFECLLEQLTARWPGPKLSFGYMNCPFCRVQLAHSDLKMFLVEHESLHQKVMGKALKQFCDDGFADALHSELGRPATAGELSVHAEKEMAMYMCLDCHEPYCGGRADCAAQQEIVEDLLCCQKCEWQKLASADDRRCMLHGHEHAIYKCDSCCSVATWNCGQHHYCERCHQDPWSEKHFPCPGPGLCPLGMPHPPNVAANLTIARNTDTTHKSFVVGCLACMGFREEGFEGARPEENAINQFGYKARCDWLLFKSGTELLAVLGEDEVRGRLLAHWPALPKGSAVECAERLLLCEQNWRSAAALVAAVADVCDGMLAERLEAVGLPSEGTVLEKARRLLLLRTVSAKEMLRAAAVDFPRDIAEVVRSLPVGQANMSKHDVAASAMEGVQDCSDDAEICGEALSYSQTLAIKPHTSIGLHEPKLRSHMKDSCPLNDSHFLENSFAGHLLKQPICFGRDRQRRQRHERLSCLLRLRARDGRTANGTCCVEDDGDME